MSSYNYVGNCGIYCPRAMSTTPEFSLRKGLETVCKIVYGTEYIGFYIHRMWMWNSIRQKGTSYDSLYMVRQKYFTVQIVVSVTP